MGNFDEIVLTRREVGNSTRTWGTGQGTAMQCESRGGNEGI